MREIVECAINTGMRRGEILSLRWNQIKDGLIYLTKTKPSEPREIPINDDLEQVFKRIRKRQEFKPKYIFTYRGKPVSGIQRAFNGAIKRAGLEDFTFRDLRHTFASQLIMRGGSMRDVRDLLGHKTMTMTLRYAHLSQKHKKKAVNLLNGLTGKGSVENPMCHKTVTSRKNTAWS